MPLTLSSGKGRKIPIRNTSHISGVKTKPKPKPVTLAPALESSDSDVESVAAYTPRTVDTNYSRPDTDYGNNSFTPKDYSFGNPDKQLDSEDEVDAVSEAGGSDVTQSAYGEAERDSGADRQLKNDLLIKLYQMQEKGIQLSRDFTMDDSLTDIQFEYNKLTASKKMRTSTELMKQGLMFTVNTLEFLNNKYDPFDIDLEGWGSHETANIHKYDDVFEELYDKYKDNVDAGPEIKFLMMFIGSAMAFHWSKQYINDVHTSNSKNMAQRKNNVEQMLNTQPAPPPTGPVYNPDPMADNTGFDMPPPPISMNDLKGMLAGGPDPGAIPPPAMTGNSVPPPPHVVEPEPETVTMPPLTTDDVSVSGESETISIPSTTTRRRKKPVTKKFSLKM